ncbi:MAG: hypothetical protein JRI76_10285, partial [Deltaproteobacteria bacterium]|nr:hypothetical protein [Deltaproteobacteria bacterium]
AMEAAEKLEIFPDRLFKTLVVLLEGKQAALALVPGSRRLDLKAAARLLGAKGAALAAFQRSHRHGRRLRAVKGRRAGCREVSGSSENLIGVHPGGKGVPVFH